MAGRRLSAMLTNPRKSEKVGQQNVNNSGAEGRIRTDTGLPPPVFELCGTRIIRFF